MGGAQSLFQETDWELADGSLRHSEETIDGRIPNATTYDVLYLTKRSLVANQRELDVTDTYMNLLYHIKPSPGTIAGFDVLGPASNEDYKLRVTVDIARRYWIIYRFDKPMYNGQLPDPVATEKFAQEQQQSGKYERKELAARISASLAIHSFSDDTPILESETKEAGTTPSVVPVPPKHLLYKVACVTVSWSRYMAVAAYYGPPTIDQIMTYTTQVEQIKKLKKKREEEKNQAMKRLNSQDTDDDDDGDILREARKIAGRRREEGECKRHTADGDVHDESGNSEGTTESSNTQTNPPNTTNPTATTTIAATIEDDTITTPSVNNVGDIPTNAEVQTSIVSSIQPVVAIRNHHPLHQHSLADDLADESESEVDVHQQISEGNVRDDNHHSGSAEIKQTLSHQEQHWHANTESQKIDALEIQTSVSMPELSHDGSIKQDGEGSGKEKSSPRVLPRHVIQKWWKESSRSIQEKSIALLNPKMGSALSTSNSIEEVNPSNPTTVTAAATTSENQQQSNDSLGASSTIIGVTSNSNHSRTDTPSSVVSGNVVSSFFGTMNNSNALSLPDDPLQGVIHLDKPLLLCQEIYTRIIGNHQTSKVSKEKVLTLLRQDMEQHLQNKHTNDDDSDEEDEPDHNSDLATAVAISDTMPATSTSIQQQLQLPQKDKCCDEIPETREGERDEANHEEAETPGPREGNLPPPPPYDPPPPPPPMSDHPPNATSDNDNEEQLLSPPPPLPSTSSVESPSAASSPEVAKEQPLVGYWLWENTLRTHKMKMTLAKGTDVALHVVLAVLVNQVRYERNAIAIAV